jgi:hypothetical protein
MGQTLTSSGFGPKGERRAAEQSLELQRGGALSGGLAVLGAGLPRTWRCTYSPGRAAAGDSVTVNCSSAFRWRPQRPQLPPHPHHRR